eukprot:4990862-Karenia_brevis.AAC.1
MFDPPCGTASRAREIRRRTGPDPKPLRSETHPDGLPLFSGLARHKVDMANILYKFVATAFVTLVNRGIVCIIENP